MIANILSKHHRCYSLLPPRIWSEFQRLSCCQLQGLGPFCVCRFSSSHWKMIGMRRGLWGKISRQNQRDSRENLSFSGGGNFQDPSTIVTSSSGTEDSEQMLATEELKKAVHLPAKRARLDAEMPTNVNVNALKTPVLRFAKLSENATAPRKGTDFAAGYDLYSACDCVIPAQGKKTVPTDIQIELPEGCYGRIAPRSGLAHHHHIDLGAGVVDRDYRGNVGVVMFNLGQEEFKVEKGTRIAQLICERIFYPELEEVDKLEETERGSKGYGSTGSK